MNKTSLIELKKYVLSFALIFIFAYPSVYAQEPIDEDALFSNPETIIETTGIVNVKMEEEEKKTVDFSGEITASSDYMLSRDKDEKDNSLSSSVYANFFIDARLKRGTKYFANLELLNNSQTENSDFLFSFKESFIDFNIKNAVYFRTGKQVLQWGRCYLWNPSDVINIEKKSFIKELGYREGTYGVKIHMPFGTKYNMYSFIDTKDANDTDELGLALKYEFIVRKTELK